MQTVDIEAGHQTFALTADRPVGPAAPPTDLRFDDHTRTLSWTDNATGELSYHLAVAFNQTAGEFDLPAGATSFAVPPQFAAGCGLTRIQILLAAVGPNGSGYPVDFESSVISDCVPRSPDLPVVAPNTGTGPTSGPSSRPALPLALLAVGLIFTSIGLAQSMRKARHERIANR